MNRISPKGLDAGIINSAKNIPLSNIKNKINDIGKDKTILTYCKNGVHSKTAASILSNNKFENVYALKGGFTAWKEAGLPIEK